MHIEIKVGKETLALRGHDKSFEICRLVVTTRKRSGTVSEWCGFAWYPTLEGAFHCLLKMKIARSDASTFLELQQEIKKAKEELAGYYS